MRKSLIILLPVILMFLARCGINPPTGDLNLAKSMLSKAEEAKADQFAPDEYKTSKDQLALGEKNIVPKKDKKNEEAKKQLQASLKSATNAYKKAAPLYAQYNITNAQTVQRSADDLKSAVALKDNYEKAKAMLDEAQADATKGSYETSWDKAIKAKAMFEEVVKIVQEKKDNADKAIKSADESIKDAEQRSKP
jgi:hypothetical protein